MDQAFLLPTLIWILVTIFFLFDKSFSIAFKILIVAILGFQCYFWWNELYSAFKILYKTRGSHIVKLARDSFQLALLSLSWIWPASLISSIIFPGSDYRNKAILTAISFSVMSITGYILLNWFSFK